MLVRAIQDGYYGHRRIKVGKKFHIKKDVEFSKVWMEKLSKGKKVEDDDILDLDPPKVAEKDQVVEVI